MLKVLEVAIGELGYLEKASNAQLDDPTANAGSANYTKYARDLDMLGVYNGPKNGFEWCDIFVDWCMIKAYGLELGQRLLCQPMGSLGAGCTYSAQYYRDNGRFYASPQPGDQIFFSRDGGKTIYHTGFVKCEDSTRVYTIEGNTSGASGVIANGGGVCLKSYPLDYAQIAGYGRPDYSIVEEDVDMNQEQFAALWKEYRKTLQDNDSGTWSQEARDWAVNNGLIVGSGTSEDGQPNYMWEDLMTREQLVTVLFRFAQLMGRA